MRTIFFALIIAFILVFVGAFGYNAQTDAQTMLRHLIRDVAEFCHIVKDEVKENIK